MRFRPVGIFQDLDHHQISALVFHSTIAWSVAEADSYDGDSNVVSSTDGDGNITLNSYDGDELTQALVLSATSQTVSFQSDTYDADGNERTSTDALGDVTSNTYSGDRLASTTVARSTGPDNSSVAYTYDEDGNVLTTTDGDGNITSNSWDGGLLRSTTITSSNGATTVGITYYSYDDDGNLTSVTDADGRTILSYFNGNRMVSQTWENSGNSVVNSLAWSYDADGNVTSASNDAGGYSMSYNGDELVAESGPFGVSLSDGYDADGNVNSIIDSQGGTTSLTYGGNGEVLTETYQDSSNQFLVNYTYDQEGNLATETRYSDLSGSAEVGFTQIGDSGDEITSISEQNGGGGVLASYSYSYDNAGWLSSKVQNGVSTSYGYNAAGEVTLAGTQSYSYDENGNSIGTGITIGPDNQLKSDGTWNYSYDAAGNETGKIGISNGLTWSYGYDDANEMTSAVETNSVGTVLESGTYVYDVFGNRIEEISVISGTTTAQRYVYGEDGTLYADQNGSNTITTRYVADTPMGADHWLAAVSTTSGVNWLLSDYQGSVCDVVNNSGTVECVTVYDAFGNITSQSNASAAGRLGFQGGQTDIVTGLSLFMRREYNSATGRWDELDPEGFAAGQSNLYEFAGNGPTDATDPSGKAFIINQNAISKWGENLSKWGYTYKLVPVTLTENGNTENYYLVHLLPAGLEKAQKDLQTEDPDSGEGWLDRGFTSGWDTIWRGDASGNVYEFDTTKSDQELVRQAIAKARDGILYDPRAAQRQAQNDYSNTAVAAAGEGLKDGATIVGDQLTFGMIESLHNESERLIEENGGLYEYSKLSGQIAAEALSSIVTGGAANAAGKAVFAGLGKLGSYFATLLIKDADKIQKVYCGVQTAAKAVGLVGQAKAVYDETAGVINHASKALKAYESGETKVMLRELVDTGVGGFSLGKTVQNFTDLINQIRKKGLWGYLKSCFAAGTPLRTPEGSKAIEEFQPGDLILARDEFDPDGPVEVKVVEAVFSRTGRILGLRIGGEVIETTAEHPFYVQGAGWKRAGELAQGDLLRTLEDGWLAVQEVDDTEVYETVYNLRVSDYHTYFVGGEEWGFSVWAHNASNYQTDGPENARRRPKFRRATQSDADGEAPLASRLSDHAEIRVCPVCGVELGLPMQRGARTITNKQYDHIEKWADQVAKMPDDISREAVNAQYQKGVRVLCAPCNENHQNEGK